MAIETLRPNGALANLVNLTGAPTDIDQDPDGTITDAGLITPDPSGQSGLTNGPELANTSAAVTGFTATTLTSEANIYDGSDTTFATHAPATNNVDYGRFFSFAAADFTDIPANAVITGIAVRARLRATSNNRLSVFMQLGTANGSLIGSEGQLDGGTPLSNSVANYGASLVPPFGVVPTRAQLITGTFGIRMRWRRTNTVTLEIYALELTITYSLPGSTTNTQADIPVSNPVNSLTSGATSELRALARKKGSGTNPQARLEIRNAAGTLLATPVANSAVSGSAVALNGTFANSAVSDPADIVVRFVGTGAEGGAAELVAVEVNADTQAAAVTEERTVTGDIPPFSGSSLVTKSSSIETLGTLSPLSGSSLVTKSALKVASGSVSPFSGSTAFTFNDLEIVVGSLSAFSGSVLATAPQIAERTVTGSMAPFSGSAVISRVLERVVSGAVSSFSGSSLITKSAQKLLSGSLSSFSGSSVVEPANRPTYTVTGHLGPFSGSTVLARQESREVAGSVESFAGSTEITREETRIVTGSVKPISGSSSTTGNGVQVESRIVSGHFDPITGSVETERITSRVVGGSLEGFSGLVEVVKRSERIADGGFIRRFLGSVEVDIFIPESRVVTGFISGFSGRTYIVTDDHEVLTGFIRNFGGGMLVTPVLAGQERLFTVGQCPRCGERHHQHKFWRESDVFGASVAATWQSLCPIVGESIVISSDKSGRDVVIGVD